MLDGEGRIVGLLDRDAMILGLREQGEGGPVGEAMRASEPLLPGQPLMEAFTRMRGRGANAEVVMDAGGACSAC